MSGNREDIRDRVPRVSVVLPCYNHAPFVSMAVESVLSQSLADLELIVIDDGSTDGTAERLSDFSDPRMNLELWPANRGYSNALNACIAKCRGEFIALLCSDDYFLPGKLERQVRFLDAAPHSAAVFGMPLFVDRHGQPCPDGSHPFAGIFLTSPQGREGWLRHFFLHGNALCHPTALLRRAAVERVGGYHPLLVQLQDYDFWARFCGMHEISVLDEPVTAYRVLGAHGNTSWPTPEALRRAAWEEQRVLRRFLDLDPDLVRRAIARELESLGIAGDCPFPVALGMVWATCRSSPARQYLALDLLEKAVEAGSDGIDRITFREIAGRLDPFNVGIWQTPSPALVIRWLLILVGRVLPAVRLR